MTKSPVFFSEI